MNNDSLHYAGFYVRLNALLWDVVVWLPVVGLVTWAAGSFRLFHIYWALPGFLLGLFYYIFLVKRYGGTPGKLIAGIRIRKVDGSPVGWREAILRHLPSATFGLLGSIATVIALQSLSDAEYLVASWRQQMDLIGKAAPSWNKPVTWASNLWFWSELVILLTNKKRRALHDFLAGTVVIHTKPVEMRLWKFDPRRFAMIAIVVATVVCVGVFFLPADLWRPLSPSPIAAAGVALTFAILAGLLILLAVVFLHYIYSVNREGTPLVWRLLGVSLGAGVILILALVAAASFVGWLTLLGAAHLPVPNFRMLLALMGCGAAIPFIALAGAYKRGPLPNQETPPVPTPAGSSFLPASRP